MSGPALHGSFTLVRDFDAAPERVFSAYADPVRRRRWFRIPGRGGGNHELDFRPGGHETLTGEFAPMGTVERIEVRSRFIDIVPDRRIVRTYELLLDGDVRWASLVVVELEPAAGGTRLSHSEHYVMLRFANASTDDVAHLKGSTQLQMNALAAALGD